MKISLVKNINSLDSDAFNLFVETHPNGNFFQTLKAYKYYASLEGFKPVLFVATQDEEIVGSLLAVVMKEKNILKAYLSRRCIIYGGPIIKNNDPKITHNLLHYFDKALAKKVIYSEFRSLFKMDCCKAIFESNDYKYEEHLNYIVPISSVEDNKKLLSSSKKRQINLSLKNSAEIIEARDISDVKSFYLILKDLYIRKVKKPLPDFNFFKNFFNAKELGKLFLVKHDERIIGGIMCPIYKDKIYEWFVCGLDGEIKNIYPSVLATWAPIEYAANNGLKYFDFLGAGKPDEDYGVREFKAKFGGDLVNYGRLVKIYNKTLYNIGKSGMELIGKFK